MFALAGPINDLTQPERIDWRTTWIEGQEYQLITRSQDNQPIGLLRQCGDQFEATTSPRPGAPAAGQLFDQLEAALTFLVVVSQIVQSDVRARTNFPA